MRARGDYPGLFGARNVEFEPGTCDRYSNYGYVLLGAPIEKVGGMPYFDYAQQRTCCNSRVHFRTAAGVSSSG